MWQKAALLVEKPVFSFEPLLGSFYAVKRIFIKIHRRIYLLQFLMSFFQPSQIVDVRRLFDWVEKAIKTVFLWMA